MTAYDILVILPLRVSPNYVDNNREGIYEFGVRIDMENTGIRPNEKKRRE